MAELERPRPRKVSDFSSRLRTLIFIFQNKVREQTEDEQLEDRIRNLKEYFAEREVIHIVVFYLIISISFVFKDDETTEEQQSVDNVNTTTTEEPTEQTTNESQDNLDELPTNSSEQTNELSSPVEDQQVNRHIRLVFLFYS